METTDLNENVEKAHETNQRAIGLSMAVFAVLLAIATMLGHRTHTEEVLIQTRANDQWAYYQAKTIRSHMYEADAELAQLMPNGAAEAAELKTRAEVQKTGAEQVKDQAQEKEHETDLATHKANQFDTAEIFLEISIVLCSITLLTRARAFWLVSFVSTVAGAAFMARGLLLRG